MPLPRKPRKFPLPCVGYPVQWFDAADPTTEPVAAIVLRINKEGVAELALFTINGGEPEIKRGVRNVADPVLKANREAAIRCGGWAMLGDVQRPETEQDIVTELIDTYAKAGKSPEEISELIAIDSVTVKSVRDYLNPPKPQQAPSK